MESRKREDYEELGEELEGEVQEMEERSSDFSAEIDDVQQDWQSKEQDGATAGAQQADDHLVLQDRKEQDDAGSETASAEEGSPEEEGEAQEGALEEEGFEETGGRSEEDEAG